ncbi:MAG: hypothetical protein M1817_003637 [Caeruleum heppii]|nr:MAG: hypothetical protein M1817_003637 [Caeruleum heppii]
MGNAQSASTPSPREQMRITKPRTNRSSTNLLAKPSLDTLPPQTPPKDPRPISRIPETEPVITSATGDRRSRQDARQSLKTHLFDTRYDPTDEPTPDPHTIKSNGFGSFVEGIRGRLPKSASQKSLPLLPNATVSSLTLNTVGGSKMSLLLEHDEPRPNRERMQQEIEAKTYADQATARERPPYYKSPSRRRSMLTPGIATRGQPSDVLRKAPPSDPSPPRSYFQPKPVPDMDTYSRVAHLNLEDGRMSPSYPRVSTPCELDYSSLHGLKRGTLRITNGCASPVPSVRSVTPFENVRPKTPLMVQQARTADSPEVLPAETALMMAQHYIRELPSRSFSAASTPVNGLDLPQNAPSLPKSRLFIDEGIVTSPTRDGPRTNAPSSRPSPETKGQIRPELGHSASSNEINESPTSHILRQYSSGSSSLAVKSLAKSDSGYSSHTSLSSLSKGTSPEQRFQESPTGKYKGSSGTARPSKSPPMPSKPKVLVEADAAPMVPPKPPKVEFVRMNSAPVPERRPTLTSRHSVGVSYPAKSDMKVSRSSDNIVAQVRFEADARSSRHRKLQKKTRPTSQPPSREKAITVQGHREVSGQQLPPVPVAISARLAQRLKDFPTLEQTFPTLQHMLSREKLQPVSPPSDMATVAGETTQFDDAKPNRQTPKPKTHKRRHIPSFGKKRESLFNAHSSPAITPTTSITDFGTVVESLGGGPYDIALPPNSSSSASCSRRNSLQHPHQMSTASLQPCATVGMDEETAASLARERSRDRRLMTERNMSRPRSMVESIAENKASRRDSSRPISMYEDGPTDPRGEEQTFHDQNSLRRRSMFPAPPPVPALPRATIGAAGASVEDIPRILRPAEAPVRGSVQSRVANFPSKPEMPPQRQSATDIGTAASVRAPTTASEEPAKKANPSSAWESHQQAWRQRRLSAGEGLKLKKKTSLTPLSEDSLPRNGYSEVMPSNDYQSGLELDKRFSRQHLSCGPPERTVRNEVGRSTAGGGGGGFDHRYGYGGRGLDLRDVPLFVEP